MWILVRGLIAFFVLWLVVCWLAYQAAHSRSLNDDGRTFQEEFSKSASASA